MELRPIAYIHTQFPEKFGIPRQAGLVPELRARIVFEPEFRNPDALRGLEGFSHLWLIWEFSASVGHPWSPTVRPPRLGGNERLGVFATRSPFRPNSLGLSCVRLERIVPTREEGTVLEVSGADLLDGTPIYDVKPYLPYADCIPEAVGGFAASRPDAPLEVVIPDALAEKLPQETLAALRGVLAQDPRPRYQDDPARSYGMGFAGWELRFRVEGCRLLVTELNDGRQKNLENGCFSEKTVL